MCNQIIHPARWEDSSISRRGFIATGVAAAIFPVAADAAVSVVETDITFATPDGMADAVLLRPSGKGPWPAVLVWTDILGLRPVFRQLGRRLAAQGYVVLVPNPYYRERRAPVVGERFDFNDTAAFEEILGYRQRLTNLQVERDARAAIAFLDAQPATDRSRSAGVQGYCMGGDFAFRTAAGIPNRIAAVGSFHGADLVTDAPDSPHRLIHKTRASFLVAIARDDDRQEPKSKDDLEAAFKGAKRPAKVDVYPADHGWCVPGSDEYAVAAAERAWTELSELYRTTL